MLLISLLFFWPLLLQLSTMESQYIPQDYEVLSCDPSTTQSSRLQQWTLLNISKLQSFGRFGKPEFDSGNDPNLPSACIFQSQYNSSFPVSPGPKFIRLHFLPTSVHIAKASFNISIFPNTLLTISRSSYTSEVKHIIKEYCVQIKDEVLSIIFTPSLDYTDAFAFVNMIEVVSMPPHLYFQNLPIPIIMHHTGFCYVNTTALETVVRLNIGGSDINPKHDTGMFRSWSKDEGYLLSSATTSIHHEALVKYSSAVPEYTAPKEVYTTARTKGNEGDLTWSFLVDSGFFYLIRLHICEYRKSVASKTQNEMVLQISFGEIFANYSISVRSEFGVPTYRDLVVNLSRKHQHQTEEFMMISLQQNKTALHSYPILNGLEIFKLSDHRNSLAGPNPLKAKESMLSSSPILTENERVLTIVVGAIVISLLVIPFGIFIYSAFDGDRTRFPSQKSLQQCHHFSLAEMKLATNNFSDSSLLGEGGFGKVYKGSIDDGKTAVAIKRAAPQSHQGLNEFQTEIVTLSRLRHLHLVSLIGCCVEENEMILVYNFMEQGTLRDHLYKAKKPPLPWKHRLKICIGAARGLHYLHTGATQTIIHRDVKSSNILLDENLVAKISDFGLSKIGPSIVNLSGNIHVSTLVKGSFGYMDPEYFRRQKLTEKSDVYSFGVVLFETIFARPAVLQLVENEEEHEKVSLAECAINCCHMGNLDCNIDPFLRGKINPQCLKTYMGIARKCLAEKGSDRPAMGEVVWNLELALQHQIGSEMEATRVNGSQANSRIGCHSSVAIDDQPFLRAGNSDPTPGIEFSEIMAPTGR